LRDCGCFSLISIGFPPAAFVSVHTTSCIACSGVIHGPPLFVKETKEHV